MKLSELAFACYVYAKMDEDDSSYSRFLAATNNTPDLGLVGHRTALLKWLNAWGCRQFAVEYHRSASEEIRRWHERWGHQLFPATKPLLDLDDEELRLTDAAYTDLTERTASKRKRASGNAYTVKVGPTGASKILFAIRPQALPPWDEPVREHLRDYGVKSYVDYLARVMSELAELADACSQNGLALSDLPRVLGQPYASLVKLVDEYYWVTISRRCPPPEADVLAHWSAWK